VALLLDAKQAAETLSVCERTIRDLADRGEITAIRMGRRCVRYALADLERFVAEKSKLAAPVPSPVVAVLPS